MTGGTAHRGSAESTTRRVPDVDSDYARELGGGGADEFDPLPRAIERKREEV